MIGTTRVVPDIGLPDINGYDVGRRLRDLPGGRTLALIALSGSGNPRIFASVRKQFIESADRALSRQ